MPASVASRHSVRETSGRCTWKCPTLQNAAPDTGAGVSCFWQRAMVGSDCLVTLNGCEVLEAQSPFASDACLLSRGLDVASPVHVIQHLHPASPHTALPGTPAASRTSSVPLRYHTPFSHSREGRTWGAQRWEQCNSFAVGDHGSRGEASERSRESGRFGLTEGSCRYCARVTC